MLVVNNIIKDRGVRGSASTTMPLAQGDNLINDVLQLQSVDDGGESMATKASLETLFTEVAYSVRGDARNGIRQEDGLVGNGGVVASLGFAFRMGCNMMEAAWVVAIGIDMS